MPEHTSENRSWSVLVCLNDSSFNMAELYHTIVLQDKIRPKSKITFCSVPAVQSQYSIVTVFFFATVFFLQQLQKVLSSVGLVWACCVLAESTS